MTDENYERLYEKIEDLQDRVRELEITLHGKRAKTGLLAEYQRHDELLARLYAVVWQDPTGQKGILHDIDILMERRKARQAWSAQQWTFWTSIVVAVITSGSTIFLNLDKIKSYLPKYDPSPLTKKIERAKHPKGKPIYRYRIKTIPPSSTPEEAEKSLNVPPE